MTLAIIISLVLMVWIGYTSLGLTSFFNSNKFKRLHKDECKGKGLFDKHMIGGL